MKIYKLITDSSLVIVKSANSLYEAMKEAREDGYVVVAVTE